MNIGFLGLGKLGLPVALAIESKGHTVFGTDINDLTLRNIRFKTLNYKEKGASDLLKNSKLQIKNISNIVSDSDIIFVPIQTPHEEKYEGSTRIPNERADFNYEFLKNGIKELSDEIEKQSKDKIVVIISTVLPGTIRSHIKPLLGKHTKLCYNPYFIAMGTTIDDFLGAEINLFGVDDEHAAKKVESFYKTINDAPFFKTTIENAELIKVVYNTFISTKISMINTIMETCHKLPNTNVDEISRALSLCDKRIISNKYLFGGMGDGGGCHPRDNIALSYLADKLNLSYNWYNNIMQQREKQTEWLANLCIENKLNNKINILGKCFKPETNLILGSPSILLKNILEEKGEEVNIWDPWVDEEDTDIVAKKYNWDKEPQLYFIGTKHEVWNKFYFKKNDVVIDPFRYLNLNNDVKYIPIGDNTWKQ
jgi:UDPglucose 6-dehydrogenase|tara:strand:+ start:121 stop:1392 length:1272 start_codon:yes stop_codon:yes gene_type:complete